MKILSKINDFIEKDYKSSNLNCGFMINPYRFGLIPTFSDDFSSYASQPSADASWVPNDTAKCRVNITNDNLDFNIVMDSTSDHIYRDLTSVSDSAWVLRFKVRFSALTSGADVIFMFGLHNITAGAATVQDSIQVKIGYEATKQFGHYTTDGTSINNNAFTQNNTYTVLINTDYYVELKRTGTTSFISTLYSDSAYTTVLTAPSSGTCAATCIGLRYLKLANIITTAPGSMVGTIDDIKFYNGVTSV